MIKNQVSVENHIFEGKIKEYEEVLIQFVLESGRAKSVDPSLQLILGFIGIHKKLTQKQLRNLTGLSTGTISKKLRDILVFGIVRKERIPKTNEYLYISAPEAYLGTAAATFEDFTKINEYLKKKIIELERFKDKQDAVFLSERIKGLLKTFETVQNIWSDIEFIFEQKRKGSKL
ncbi:MAG: MarR family transcriptional regulator [Promethearchaeota archaeon]|jgi:DNA-binding transcriptional regulator GbsR (MarR family)